MSRKPRQIDVEWKKIFTKYNLMDYDFSHKPYCISGEQIRGASTREIRLLCKQDSREDRPLVFQERNLFILPIRKDEQGYYYNILQGEGYVDIPPISTTEAYTPNLDFPLHSSEVGNSEMQHLDHAYAISILRTFVEDDSLVLTIRGRKYTPSFSMRVGEHQFDVKSVQTEIDAGYEGRTNLVLVEAKNSKTRNVIIRQLYYPYRQWAYHMAEYTKRITTVFFERSGDDFCFWQFQFEDQADYNSIKLVKNKRYKLTPNPL